MIAQTLPLRPRGRQGTLGMDSGDVGPDLRAFSARLRLWGVARAAALS